LGTALFHVIIPLQVAYALQAIIARNFPSVYQYALVIFVLAISYCVLWWFGGIAIAKCAEAGLTYIQREAIANYLEKDYEFYVDTHIGSLSSQATRLRNAFMDYANLVNNGLSTQIVIVISSIVIIAWQSWILALVTLFSMALILSFTVAGMKWRLKYRYLVSEAQGDTDGQLGDVLGHGPTVKSFANESYEKTRLDPFFVKLSRIHYRSWVASIPPDIGRHLLAAIATLTLLILTARLYEDNLISIAIILLIQFYVLKLITATTGIAGQIQDYDSLMTSAYQAVKTMLIPSAIVDKKEIHALPNSTHLDVAFHGVSYGYGDCDQKVFAVHGFTLEIAQGQKVGLVGYSGSGKTTLTKLLLRFMDIDDGRITLGGIDIRDITQQELRTHIAYVPQEPLLFHRSVFENIAYGKPAATEKEIHEAARAAYIDEFIEELGQGYHTVVGEKGVRLSGGQRQRVAIARAILKNAPILVLDEATSALDSQSEHYIQKALWELMKDRTTLVIAHRLSTIQRMDKIVVMDKGQIVDIGTHDELLGKPDGIYAKLWQHQSKSHTEKALEISL
jgi:ATP-binding cassette subfamily B protein